MRFSIRKESFNRNKKIGEITSRIFFCCEEGFRSKDTRNHLTKIPRAEIRKGCYAQMGIKLNDKGFFFG